jgi:DNA-directed RNA polymerase II subunit RPB1
VPRLKELLKVTKSPKAISLTAYLKPEFRQDKEKAREVCQDLELTLLRDVTTRAAIYYDPKDEETVVDESDKELIAFYKAFEKGIPDEDAAIAPEEEVWSRWMLRLELDRERLFGKNISMEDIAFVLRQKFDDEVHLIYSDFNSPRLIMRIRLPAIAKSGLDDLANLKKFVNRLLNGIVIRGVTGIKSMKFREDKDVLEYKDGKYEKVTQYVLDSDGTNFQAVLSHPMVDGRKLVSSHVHDIFENLGIEATRAVLLNEIIALFEAAGADVNFRHPGLLCDVMTRGGKLMSADRYGINKNDIGPLAKASFEETEKILLRAAVFGEVDPVTGVSANIMTGQVIKGGTAFSQILLDEMALLRLQENLPPVEDIEEEEEGPTDEQVEDELFEDSGDICSKTRLRMNITMPTEAVLVNEPDVDMIVLED